MKVLPSGMAKEKVTLTLDAEKLAGLRALVGAKSLSASVDSAIGAHLARLQHLAAVDAAVFGELRRERVLVHPVDTAAGVRAGRLLGAARRGSEHAVDAFLVAVADLGGGAVIATVAAEDLRELAAHAKGVVVASIQPGHR
jgi:hypothetical protein